MTTYRRYLQPSRALVAGPRRVGILSVPLLASNAAIIKTVPIVIVAGPTCAGKSTLAAAIAPHLRAVTIRQRGAPFRQVRRVDGKVPIERTSKRLPGRGPRLRARSVAATVQPPSSMPGRLRKSPRERCRSTSKCRRMLLRGQFAGSTRARQIPQPVGRNEVRQLEAEFAGGAAQGTGLAFYRG